MRTLAASSPTVVEHAGLTLEDQWFAALDGRLIHVGARPRHIHILGIHREGDGLWIQLAPLNDSDRGIVIHCRHAQPPDEVLDALRVHLCAGRSRPLMIEALSVI